MIRKQKRGTRAEMIHTDRVDYNIIKVQTNVKIVSGYDMCSHHAKLK